MYKSPQSLERWPELSRRGVSEIESNEVAESLVRREQLSWSDADVLRQGQALQLQCIQSRRQLHPQKVAALGLGNPYACRKMLGNGLKRHVPLRAECPAQHAQVLVVTPLLEVVQDAQLHWYRDRQGA